MTARTPSRKANMTAKPKRVGDGSPEKQVATIVSADGTDEEFFARCAEHVEGWDRLTDMGRAEVVRLMRHFWNLPRPPAVEVENVDGVVYTGTPEGLNTTLHALRQIEAWASTSPEYGNARLGEIVNHHSASNRPGATTKNVAADVAFIHGAKPTDTVQSTLLVQMAATHDAAMRSLAMVGKAEWTEQAQVFGNLSTKLLNAFTRQAETLHKLQRGGEQVVRHIYVDNRHGGQAVIAEHFVKEGSREDIGYPSHALSPTLLGQDPQGNGLPVPGDPGAEAVSNAQRASKGPAGK